MNPDTPEPVRRMVETFRQTFGDSAPEIAFRTFKDCDAAEQWLTTHATTLYNDAVREEMRKCMKDVCMYCAGHCPPYHTAHSEKPNAAGNYTHASKDGKQERLCAASSIISRSRFVGEPFAVEEVVITPPTDNPKSV